MSFAMASPRRLLVLGAVTLSGVLVGAGGEGKVGVGVQSASAATAPICTNILPYDRCVSTFRYWLYGVGYYNDASGSNSVCMGAKTQPDGSGGNAIPFTCAVLTSGQTRWTPGGQSNWGYATVINQWNQVAWGTPMMNYQP